MPWGTDRAAIETVNPSVLYYFVYSLESEGNSRFWKCRKDAYDSDVTSHKSARSRRKLGNVVERTAITSYFTEQEKQDIASAAESQGISMSAFVAAAALKDARLLKVAHRRSSASPKS